MKPGELFLSVCGTLKNTSSSDADLTASTSTEATGQTPTKVCRDCSVELDDSNWAASFKKNDNTTCKSCYNTRHNEKNNPLNNKQRMYVNGKYIPNSHPLYKAGRYKSFDDAAFSGLENYERSTEGMVYIITNPAWPKWVKIGMAVDADDRCNGYQTSSPFRDYSVVATISTKDRRKAEALAHTIAEKLATERRNEWFKLKPSQAKQVLAQVETELNGL